MWTLRGTIRGDPQETLCRVRSPIRFVRSFILSRCNNNEAERSIWVMGPSSGKEQQCGSDAKLSRHRVVDTHTCVQRAHKGMSQRTGRSIRDQRCKDSLLCWMVFPPWRPFLVRRRNHWSLCWVLYFAVTVIWYDRKLGKSLQPKPYK